jgi:hypothetical protein
MRALKSLFAELLGLFVDDGAFAAAIALWVVLVCEVLPRLERARTWGAAVLFGGLAVILIAGTVRRARP